MLILSAHRLPLDEQAKHCRLKIMALRAVTNRTNAAKMDEKAAPYHQRLTELKERIGRTHPELFV